MDPWTIGPFFGPFVGPLFGSLYLLLIVRKGWVGTLLRPCGGGGKKVLVLRNAPKEFSPHLIVIAVFSLQFSKRTRPAERMNRPFHLLLGLNKSMCRLFERITAPLSHKIQTFYFEKLAGVLINCAVLKVSSIFAVNELYFAIGLKQLSPDRQ